jgi:hypothetical protein
MVKRQDRSEGDDKPFRRTSLQEDSGPLATPRAIYLFFDRLNNNNTL